MEKIYKISPSFSYNLIYIYSIPLESHLGRLKIGSASVNSTKIPTKEEMETAAEERIKQQTQTADIPFHLEHTELAITNENQSFLDVKVHEVLIRSGFKRKSGNIKNYHSEWFEVDLNTAKNAIQAVKEGRISLLNSEITEDEFIFQFRPNQLEAIRETIKAIKSNKKEFLWNAKMRFGKTSAAMQVAKEMEMSKVLILTHRPSVSDDWFNDFKKIFGKTNYEFSTKTRGEYINKLIDKSTPFIYFASLQDLRLSKRVVEDTASGSQAQGFDKNDEIFDLVWDMMIIDEAHEGTQSQLGDTTLKSIKNNFTLHLSGTPFNILHKQEESNIYTWDYVMEQEAKINWDINFPGKPNPYEELPELNIFTYDIDTLKSGIGGIDPDFYDQEDSAFKFHEFFRVHKDSDGNDTSEFVHKDKVKKFLDLLVNDKITTKFPYANEEYRNFNKHSLWLLPNRVKIIEAMEKLLKDHKIFGNGFGIVNISGNGHEDDEDKEAKTKVTNTIKNFDYTITLTGQRLTTGASIPEWTAVFMMSDTTSATTYLQTAFRCQTPANIDGMMKTKGYVFDFAPDRTLKLISEVIELNHKSGKTNTPEQKEAMKKFLNFCPIISSKGGLMRPYDVSEMLGQLKRAIIQRVANNGFDDPKLYNDELLKLDSLELERFNNLRKIVGSSTGEKINEIEINNLGLDNPLIENAEKIERKKKDELTESEKEILKKLKEAREQRNKAISILRGVSIRMPLLVYGSEIPLNEEINLKKFIEIVDDESWKEFMPIGLSKDDFKEFTKYYDEEVFKGVTHSIRVKAKDCDEMPPTERIIAISSLFSTFKNPDKETVLTPWNVVNLHLTSAFGGNDFRYIRNEKPEWVSIDKDTSIWSQDDTKILEINSKTGLYPLLAAYNVYTRKLIKIKGKAEESIYKELWGEILDKNIYVLCKTPMAKSITRRTIAGYNKQYKTNIIYIEDLVKKLQKNNGFNNYDIKEELYKKFNIEDEKMKFTAVVGNPPYQDRSVGDNSQMPPIYHLFMEESFKLSDKVSLITPARFLFNAGATPEEWNRKMLQDIHFKVIYYEKLSSLIFPNTDIKGGVAVFLRDLTKEIGPINVFSPHPELISILNKVNIKNEKKLNEIIYSAFSYQFSMNLHNDFPEIKNVLSKGHENDITTGIFDLLPNIFFEDMPKDNEDYVQFYGLTNKKRVYRWVKSKYIKPHPNLLKFKLWIPKANGSGLLGEELSSPIIGEPKMGSTHSFISIGSFESKEEAINLLKYVKTKFLRALLGILKVTQDNPPSKWSKIPLQDFSELSDIDWTKPIAEVDRQLYIKYNLNQKEIDFIEKNVKQMV